MVTSSNFQTRLETPERAPSSFQKLISWIIDHAWYVHQTSHIHIALSPSQTYKLLETAAKPSVNRLGLRHLFARGRRYYLRPQDTGGFQMTTTNKVWWHPKRRTQPTAILSAEIEEISDDHHRLTTQTRVKLRYLLGQFIWPTFIASIIIYLDWSLVFLVSSVVGLYALSWASHRLTAILESHEITFFIETVLNDFAPAAPEQLASGDGEVLVDEFTSEWGRYVAEKNP